MQNTELKISKVTARQISDSRGMATIEVEISAGELVAKAAVPSGKSTGSAEAFAIRDADGGVQTAIHNVEQVIGPEIIGRKVNAEEVDHLLLRMDTSLDKHNLGANATLGVSIAMARLQAQAEGIPLWKYLSHRGQFKTGKPLLYMNTLNGGAHADFILPFQEYILAVGGETLAEADEKSKAVFQKVKDKLDSLGVKYFMGDEGGMAPHFDNLEKPFEIMTECIDGDRDIFIALDIAASEFYHNGLYEVLGEKYPEQELLLLYQNLLEKFDIRSIEDPFDEKDFIGFEQAVSWFGAKTIIVGDDLTTTNPFTIREKASKQMATGVIIKPNQIGTVQETLEAIRVAKSFDWKVIASHRSGETMDTFIADLAFGVGAYGIKAGAHTQPEREAKYNRLLEIEKEFPQFPEKKSWHH